MKRIILCSLLSACTLGSYAQRVHLGIRTSFNLAKVATDGLNPPRTTQEEIGETLGVSLGGFVDVPVIAGFSLQTELCYSSSGYRHGYDDIGLRRRRFDFGYISVPLLLKYNWKGLAVLTGVQYNALTSATVMDLNGGQYFLDRKEPVKFAHKSNDWSFVAGLEYTLKFGLGFHARYQWGLTNIAVNGSTIYPTENEVKNRLLQFGVHYRFI